jgi:cell division protein ZipA
MWQILLRRKKNKSYRLENSDITFNQNSHESDDFHSEIGEVLIRNSGNEEIDTTNPTLSSLGFGGVDDVLTPVLAKPSDQTNNQREMYLPQDEDLVVVHIKAMPGKTFVGYGLQQALASAGLQFGEMSIFHFYEEMTSRQTILFSVASAVEPGIFDLQRMGGFSTPGLSLFMTIANCADPLTTLNQLLETAHQLADDLGGQLYDQHHKLFTDKTIAEYRNRVQEMALI